MDLRDLWQVDAAGRPLLTLRQIAVRLRWLPRESPLVLALGGPDAQWTIGDYLTADVYGALAGKRHPAAPRAEDKERSRDELRSLDRRLVDQQTRRSRQLEQIRNRASGG